MATKQREHEATIRRVHAESQRHNDTLATIERGVAARDKESVEKYLEWVLHTVPLPSNFPQHAEVTYNPTTEQAVVQFELPPREVIPMVRAYQYIQRSNEERASDRSAKEVAAAYRSAVSQFAYACETCYNLTTSWT